MRNFILFNLLVLGLAAHSATPSAEKIMGYQPSRNGIAFQVRSGGCTRPEDFSVEVVRTPGEITKIKLVRNRPDPCLSFLPYGIRFRLSYDAMGIVPSETYTLVNPNGAVHGWIWE